jgi:hypothetical protein
MSTVELAEDKYRYAPAVDETTNRMPTTSLRSIRRRGEAEGEAEGNFTSRNLSG